MKMCLGLWVSGYAWRPAEFTGLPSTARSNGSLNEVEKGRQILCPTWLRLIGAWGRASRGGVISASPLSSVLGKTRILLPELDAAVSRKHTPNEHQESHQILHLLSARPRETRFLRHCSTRLYHQRENCRHQCQSRRSISLRHEQGGQSCLFKCSSCLVSIRPPNPTNILGMDPSTSDLWEEAELPIAYDDHQAEFAQRRHPGTLQWFLDSDAYQKWIHATSDLDPDGQTQDFRTLFCPGLAGAGKTILTSAVVQDLTCRFSKGSNSNVGIAYFYCFYNCREQQSTTNLLLVLLEQLLPNRPRRRFPARLPRHIQKWGYESTTSPPSLVKIMESFKKAIAQYARVFLVIDALDECEAQERTALIEEIFKLQTDNKVHLFATSDPNPDVERMFTNTPSLEIKASPEDVRSYLEGRMDKLPDLVKEDPAIKEEIKDAIIKAAPGR